MYPFKEGYFAVRNAWYVAAFSREVGRELLERWFLDEPVILFRREDGNAVAMAGRCPHRQFPMAAGRLEGDVVTCGYHGIAFASDGRCTRIPTQDHVPPAFGIRTFPLVEKWQWLWIWMGDPELADPALIPDHDEIGLGLPGASSVPMHHYVVNGRYQLLNDNLLDLSHLAFLHDSRIGTEGVATTRERVETGDRTIRSVREIRDADPSPAVRARHGEVRIDFLLDFTFHAPALHVGINRISVAEGGGDDAGVLLSDSIVYHAVTPARRHQVHYFFARTLIHPMVDDGQAEAARHIAAVIEEDIFATEEIERMLGSGRPARDLLTASDVAVTKGRLMLQSMMDAELGGAPARLSA